MTAMHPDEAHHHFNNDYADEYYRENPDEFDARPYHVLNTCMCEHEDHTKKATVGEGMHPIYSAEHEGHYEHPYVGPICDDCATGHMLDTGIVRTSPAA